MIWAVDTTGPVIGAALLDDVGVSVRTERVRRGAETRLGRWLSECTADRGVEVSAITGIAVAVGPGAFTGLRVGMAHAAGLALALGVPVWGGVSLRSRALAFVSPGHDVLSVLDARKQRVYAALYGPSGELLHGPADVPPSTACGWLRGPTLAVGEGVVVYGEALGAIEMVDDASNPGVDSLARLGQEALASGLGCDPTELAPLYLRRADAVPPKDLGRSLRRK